MMHIAFISTQFVSLTLTGGLGNHLLRVGLSLVSMGHKPSILMISDRDEEKDYRGIRLVRVKGKPAPPSQRLAAGTLHANAYQSKQFRRAIRTLHAKEPIDIIQYTNYRATALYREPKIPAVMRISSYRPLWDPLHPTAAKSIKRKRAARLEQKSFYKVDSIYAPSRVLAKVISHDTGVPVDVIEPPFVMDELDQDPSLVKELTGGEPFFLFAGSLTKRKGAEVIVASVHRLLETYPDHRFVFVGKTEDLDGKDSLEAVREAAGDQAHRVVHHNPVPHGQLYPFYKAADLVLLPSIIDNIANTALEAMALGSIVVGTDGGSFEQLITDGESGFLCRVGDSDSFLAAVDRGLGLDRSTADKIRARARERIAELAPDKTIPKLLTYYAGIIREKHSS